MVDNRDLSASAFRPGEVEGGVERGTHDAQGHDADQRSGGGKAGIHQVQAVSCLANHVLLRNPHVAEAEIGGQVATMPQRVMEAIH
ncbi:hypothetical protein D3C81_1842880 [compost metagenome]